MLMYDVSDKYGLILDAEGCSLLLKDLRRIREKLGRAVEKQKKKQDDEFKMILSYNHVEEIRNDYGYGYITEEQCRRYMELYEKGQEILNNPPETKQTVALSILDFIISDLSSRERQERFDALSPEEQAEAYRKADEMRERRKKRLDEIGKQFKSNDA